MKPLFLSILVPIALMGCAQTGPGKGGSASSASQATGLVPQQQRITEENVLADRRTIEAVQQRLRRLNEAGIAQSNYSLSKAQCWLDTAKTQYHENDRSSYIEESLSEAQKIIRALEADKTAKAGFETPLVAGSTRLRDDLWAQLGMHKGNAAALACNARTVACAEVRLVRAGHAEEQTGWRAAVPHIMMVEDGIRRAALEAASCAAAPTPASAQSKPTPTATPAPTPVVREVVKETFVLLGDALFKFDGSDVGDLLPGGKERLAEVAKRLANYSSIASLRIHGHTDRLGSDEYNNQLSERRAATSLSVLQSLGVKAAQTQVLGKGKKEPVTSCADTLPRQQLIACMQPDRRVTIEVTGRVR